ncbi:MAG: FecR domain-containing protein [Burkholderiales bacterium]
MVRLVVALLLLFALGLAPAAAQPSAAQPFIEAVQSPAWVERSGVREPLAVGMVLRNSDRVVSGADARIVLRMPEGSLIKLGSQAQLALDRLSVQREPEGTLVTAALEVLRGAFRFTTQAAARFRGRRQIDVRIATLTAGIRGTDLWGKAAEERNIVCLIEGRISVQRGTEAAFVMDEPLSFYIAPKNAPPLPVQPVPPEQLQKWAVETEMQPGAGGARRNGRWRVDLALARTQAEALALYDRLREAGYPAQIRPVKDAEGYSYAVGIRHLASEVEAAGLAARLKDMPGVTQARIGGS